MGRAGRLHFPKHPIKTLRYRLLHGPAPPGGVSKNAWKRRLPKDAVIVEAGAHKGTDTVEFARMWPKGQIHAFEPIPDLYQHLKRAASDYPNVKTYPLALGERTAVERMHVAGGAGDGSSSLLPPREHLAVYPDVSFDDTAEVEVTTIAAWAEREGVTRIDGMWLDMQGYELAALKAAGPILETTQALIVEVFVVELYAGAPLWPEVREWLEGQGFHVETDAIGEAAGDALVVRD